MEQNEPINSPESHMRLAHKNLRGLIELKNREPLASLPEHIRSKILEADYHVETAIALAKTWAENKKRCWDYLPGTGG